MYRSLFAIFLLAFAITFSSCSKKPLHKSKTLEPFLARPEAGTEAWIDRLQYDDQNKIAYGYFNDENDLLIRIMATDRNTITKIFAAGFTIFLDTTGRKEPQFSIKYPLPQGMQNMARPLGRKPGAMDNQAEINPVKSMSPRIKTALNEIEIKGFDEPAIKATQLNTRDEQGITARIQVDSGSTLYYELKIPLKDIFKNGNSEKSLLSIGLESGKIDLPSNGPPAGINLRQGDGERPGGGRQGRGMHSDDNNQPQRMTDKQELSDAIKIWVKRIELQ